VRPGFSGGPGAAIRHRMPQKPQDRAKDKRRLTKRLERWRAKRELSGATPEAAGKPAGQKSAK